MKIACLGWGSLIWQPKELPVAETDWFADGPEIPVEFARHSGEERITLVVMETGPASPVRWCLLPFGSVGEASSVLRAREKTKLEWIGRWPDEHGAHYLHAATIEAWARAKDIDGVVWTAIPPKWGDENGKAPTLAEAVAHLTRLSPEAAKPAIEYILRAPAQIETPHRDALMVVARELRDRAG